MRRPLIAPLLLVLALSACSEVAEPPFEPGFLGQPILGGSPPTDARFDAVVGLIVGGYYCSGTLIAPEYVLTAGHCVVTTLGKRVYVLPPSQVQVYFGPEIAGVPRTVQQVILHPAYNHKLLGVNDVALLRLTSDASGLATPMRWLPSSMAPLEQVGTPVIFAGYGLTEYDDIGTKLVVDGSISGVETYQLRNEQDDLTGTCGGDSGGPLIYDFGGTFYVGGTTSWGDNQCTDYGYSMRISAYDAWITGHVGPVVPDCTVDADCDDSDACTTDACVAGDCVNDAIYCDDGNVCTDDFCDSVLGCEVAYNTAACNDGDECTINDICSNGACTGEDSTDPACMCLPRGEFCQYNGECCSNRCFRNRCK